MPQSQPQLIQRLLDEFERLPGIGPKSAQRIVYWLLNSDSMHSERLASAITDVKASVHFCSRCFNYAEDELCPICADTTRDQSILAVVSEPRDIVAIEKTATYRGLYHVLGGALSPMDGIGVEQLTITQLMARLADLSIHEVILATNPNVEGETTAGYLARQIKPLGIRTTRLASGLPVGGDLEFADEVTLGRAIEDRHEI
jgi:recombination protein RecR